MTVFMTLHIDDIVLVSNNYGEEQVLAEALNHRSPRMH